MEDFANRAFLYCNKFWKRFFVFLKERILDIFYTMEIVLKYFFAIAVIPFWIIPAIYRLVEGKKHD